MLPIPPMLPGPLMPPVLAPAVVGPAPIVGLIVPKGGLGVGPLRLEPGTGDRVEVVCASAGTATVRAKAPIAAMGSLAFIGTSFLKESPLNPACEPVFPVVNSP